jgi:two-component sensor histidine kinase
MIYLIVVYLLFALIVILRQRKSLSLLWFLLMPIGFSMALFGLMLFTEYTSFANFIENPLFISGNLIIWKINYFLDISVFGMYRLMNIGIALYIIGAIGYPLSQHPRRKLLRYGLMLIALPAFLILVADPGILYILFRPDTIYHGMQGIITTINTLNQLLNAAVKTALMASLILTFWIHFKTPKIFRKRSQLILIGIIPIHTLVFVLFFWFPSNSINLWRISTLKFISLPYTRFVASLIVGLSITSLAALIYTSFVYNSFEIHSQRNKTGFKARMKTAGTGLRIFTHSIKNQFIAVKLLAEQGAAAGCNSTQMQSIQSICIKTIDRLSSLPVVPDRINLNFITTTTAELASLIQNRFPDVTILKPIAQASIRIDEHYFFEILDNLVTNSREAVQEQSDPRITIGCSRQLNYLIFSVTDNGQGIAPKIQKHIFEPFYSTKPSISNWGMGLAFSQQLVEAFGGAIRVDSKPGVFTTFEIFLPEETNGS